MSAESQGMRHEHRVPGAGVVRRQHGAHDARKVFSSIVRSALYIVNFSVSLVGCVRVPAALDPAGPQAGRISDLSWLLFAVCTVVFLLVIGAVLFAVGHRRRDEQSEPPQAERRRTTVVSVAVGATMLILFLFLIASIRTGHRLAAFSSANPLTISVIGHQWRWEVHYHGATPNQTMTTANELHIPVGQPVLLKLTSHDVIHSLWVPQFHGKRDLIPGHETTMWLQANRPGVFRGQCAEFCGHQHAHMGFLIVAEPPEQFATWLDQQRQPARTPTDAATAGTGGIPHWCVRAVP